MVAPEYKEDLSTQPVIAKLMQFEWELVIRGRMKQHIANNIKEAPTAVSIHSLIEIETLSSEIFLRGIWEYYSVQKVIFILLDSFNSFRGTHLPSSPGS